METVFGALLLSLIVFICLTIYFIPSIVAVVRKKRDRWAILVLNFFLGWTSIGWVVALVWACCHDRKAGNI